MLFCIDRQPHARVQTTAREWAALGGASNYFICLRGTEHAQPDLIWHSLTTQLVKYCIWDLLCDSLSKFLAFCWCHRCLQKEEKGISLGMPARSIKLILDCLGWSQSALASWSSRQPFVHARQLEAGVGCRSVSSAWAQDACVHDVIILYITHKQVST